MERQGSGRTKFPNKAYEKELYRLQEELVKMEQWVAETGARVVVIFEGRDAAGKGGTIKRIAEHTNPRITKHVALPKPTERQTSQWYFQRYVAELPAAGEIILFDRSWYNRAGVEHVLGFCTPNEYYRFLRQCPIFERLLVEDGIILIKYWFSVSDEEQERRFAKRITDPLRRWKLSETDLYSRTKWVDYSRAKDEMFVHTDLPEAPWYVVESDTKKKARLNCISHLLSKIPYQEEVRSRDRAAGPPEGRGLRAAAARSLHLRARPRGRDRRRAPRQARLARERPELDARRGQAATRGRRGRRRPDLRIPVTNGISTFVYRRALASRRRRMQSTSESARSASNARIHSQSPSPNALVVFASTSGNSRPAPPCSRSSSPRSSRGSRYHSGVRTNGYTHRNFSGGVPFTNAGAWSAVNSAGFTAPMNIHVGSIRRPTVVRRNSTSARCSTSGESPWSQSIRSASARNPTVE